MKILMFSRVKIFDEHLRGGAKRFYELYIQLKRNYNVEMCTVDSDEEYKKHNIEGFVFSDILFDKEKPLKSIHKIIKVANVEVKEIKKLKFDRIIVFGIPSAIVLSLYNVDNIYLFLRDDLIGYRKVSMGYPEKKITIKNRCYLLFLSLIEEICLKRCKKVIVQCEHDLNELKNRHKSIETLLDKKTSIQINNVNPLWIVKNSNFLPMEMKLNNVLKVGFIGNFNNEQKGNKIFLDAAQKMEKKDIEFYVAGTGKAEIEYRRKYTNRNIHFCGWISNSCSFIKACDLIIVPSLADSCPNTIMEALYCGVPVIGSNRGGIPDILNKKEWIFEPDSDAICEMILRIMEKNTLENIKKMQREREKELEFDWAKLVVKIISE